MEARWPQRFQLPLKSSSHLGIGRFLLKKAGAGLVLLPTFIVGEDISAGRLQLVLDDYPVEELNIFAVYPHRQYLSAKVRTFVDFLGDYFGSPPYWDCR